MLGFRTTPSATLASQSATGTVVFFEIAPLSHDPTETSQMRPDIAGAIQLGLPPTW